MSSHYLDITEGKNGWKRYLSSIIVIGSLLTIFSVLLVFGLIAVFNLLNIPIQVSDFSNETIFDNALIELLNTNLNMVIWFLLLWVCMIWIHKRKLRTLITTKTKIDWGKIFFGFSLFSILLLVVIFAEMLFFPSYYSLNDFDFIQFSLLLCIVLLLTPIQTTIEELFFRGFLLQWFAKKGRNKYILSSVIAIIFGSLHFTNPEMGQSAFWVGLDYIFVGFMLTFIAITFGSLELSIGLHAGNNMVLFLLLSDEMSVGGSIPAIFQVVERNPAVSTIMDIVITLIFYFICRKKYKKDIVM